MANTARGQWAIDHDAFPMFGTTEAKLRFLVQYAVLAPSSHNTQPWLFRIAGDVLELWRDDSRVLAVSDPDERELTASCGAALFHLRLAARYFGYIPRVTTFPAPELPGLLARLRLGERQEATPEEYTLFEAIPRRRTNRQPFEAHDIPRPVVDALRLAAAAEGAWLQVVAEPTARDAVTDLIYEGDRAQWSNPAFRRELARWIQPASHGDGLPSCRRGLDPCVVRTFDVGQAVAELDRRLAAEAPVLAVLGTTGDTPADWLTLGQALARVLLRARVAGISASFLNQPVQVRELRRRLADIVEYRGYPQLLIRFGYGKPIAAAPRRAVSEVLLPTDAAAATDR